MAAATYEVRADIDRDSLYAHARSNLTAYVLRMTWNNGMSAPGQEVAPPARLTLTLDNSSGAFDFDNAGAAYYGLLTRGTLVRVRATYSSTTHTLFIGKISALKMDAGVYAREVTLQAADLMSELLDAEYAPPLQTNVRTDEVLTALFDSGVTALPYASDYWILGVAGHSELGSTTYPVGASNMIAFDEGQTTLAYAGDNAGTEQGVSAQGYIRDAVAAECGGRFFFNSRTGLFTFHSRHHDINYSIAETFNSGDAEAIEYAVDDDIVNRAVVSYSPRAVGVAGSVLWTLDKPITLEPGQVKTLTARYRDPDNEKAQVGAIDPLMPAVGADYTAIIPNTVTSMTQWLNVTVSFGGSSASVQLVNGHGALSLSVETLVLRGTPLYSYGKQDVTVFDGDSFADYGLYEKKVNLRMVDDDWLAQLYASSIVAQYRRGQTLARTITFNANKSSTRMGRALTCAPGTAITIADSSTGHDADYVIVGERHRVTAGGEHTHEVILTLKPLARAQYWILGVPGFSELGSTTYPAF